MNYTSATDRSSGPRRASGLKATMAKNKRGNSADKTNNGGTLGFEADPCCSSGRMFLQSEKFLEPHA